MSKSLRCPIRDIARALRDVSATARKWAPTTARREADDESEWIDVRLQVCEDGSWAVHSGDACFDTDHRGVWGADSVPLRGRFDSMSLAKELWNQAVDMAVDGYDGPCLMYVK